jgi:hypothetical protein
MSRPTMTIPRTNVQKPFRFSRWFHSPEECAFWIGWFAERGVSAGIVSTNKNGPRYAVWRTGDEVDKITKDMRCDRSVNGFIDQFDKRKKEAQDGDARRLTSNNHQWKEKEGAA